MIITSRLIWIYTVYTSIDFGLPAESVKGLNIYGIGGHLGCKFLSMLHTH